MTDFVISEEIVEHIESQLKNKHCKKCPYEGAGINSGILSYLRKVPLEAELKKEREKDTAKLKGELIRQSNEWKVYKQDAGMGESDYCVLFKDEFFCRTDDPVIALRIIRAVDERVGYGWQ